ncbi:UNVERIFIED_CONTAM: hypothetical protein GTU68_011286 [Idotea baltica]|nr:hypothetical protein [Idotea baltica]
MNWHPFILSFELALITTFALAILGSILVYLITTYQFILKPLVKAFISLPLVLPPTVLGYYLLLAFQPSSGIGNFLATYFGIRLAFSFAGLVIGSIIFSLPFMVNPIFAAIDNLPDSLKEASYTLGKSRWETFWRVILPNVKYSVLVGLIMAFAHTIGEFGVVLMIGGSIPGVTEVASIAIYHEVEGMNYLAANIYAGVLVLFSMLVLLGVYGLQNRRKTEMVL